MTQGLSRYQQFLMDTTPKTAEYYGDKIARLFTGGKDYMPKTVVKTNPTINMSKFNPIKGLGGSVGPALMLAVETPKMFLEAWKNSNINTMDPVYRDAMIKGWQQGKKDWNKLFGGVEELEILDDAQLTGGKSVQVNNKSGQVSGQPSVQVAKQTASQLTNQPKVTQQKTAQQEPTQQQSNIDAINDYVSKLQEINQPYINSLQKYMDDYNNMLDQRQRAARFWQGAASLTGNPAWANIGKQYDTLTNEANKVAIIKQIQDAQAGDINAINEVMGNLALAKELNLPPEAAFANKNLLTALTANRRQLTDLEKAQIMADIRRYGYDSAFARALQVQGMKGQNALDVARTYMGGGVAPGLNNQGLPQTPYQPLANKQQGGSNLQQAFDMYANK